MLLLAKSIFYSIDKDIESFKSLVKVASDPLSPHNSSEFIDSSKNVNIDSVRLYVDDYEKFQAKVSSIVQESRCRIYEPPVDSDDRNAMIFGPWNPQIHEAIRSNILLFDKQSEQIKESTGNSLATNGHSNQGISWVLKKSPGTFPKSFS